MDQGLASCRSAVDLTKYIQEHFYHFDEAFGENCSNEEV